MLKLIVYCESTIVLWLYVTAGPNGRAVERCGSTAARVLGLQFRISQVAWMSVVSVVCCQV